MAPIEALLHPPLGFADRGARAHESPNTIEAFALALRLGAGGLATEAMTDETGRVRLRSGARGRLRRRQPVPPTLEEVLAACGSGFELLVDVPDTATASRAVETASAAGMPAEQLWLRNADHAEVAGWSGRWPGVRLVSAARLTALREGPERRAADLAAAAVHAVELPHDDWTGGLTTLFHRFGILTIATGAEHAHQLDRLLHAGCDALTSGNVDALADAIARFS